MSATCSMDQCARPALVFGRALCRAHYRRWQRHGDPQVGRLPVGASLRDRFESYVERDGLLGCWLWTGGTNGQYGELRVGQKIAKAHRVAFEMYVGPIPAGLEVDHLCRNTRCVNPAHLEPVTKAENVRRGWPFRADFKGATA